MKNKSTNSHLSFGQKLLFGFMGAQFMAAFAKESLKIKREKSALSGEQLNYLTNEIVNSSVYQALIREGKSAKEITKILDIHKMNPEKFETITGKKWPF